MIESVNAFSISAFNKQNNAHYVLQFVCGCGPGPQMHLVLPLPHRVEQVPAVEEHWPLHFRAVEEGVFEAVAVQESIGRQRNVCEIQEGSEKVHLCANLWTSPCEKSTPM